MINRTLKYSTLAALGAWVLVLAAGGQAGATTPQFEQAKIKAPDAAQDDALGRGVAIYGDYAVVGAPRDDAIDTDSGSVYFYKRSGSSWTRQSKESWGEYCSYFGETATIWGDWAIVGAPSMDGGAMSSGAAYLFKRTGDIWTKTQRLVDPSPSVNGYYGSAVSVHGDYAVVGGDYRSVHVYQRSGDTWNKAADLTPSTPTTDCFGHNVSISDNYAIVGSWNNSAGLAYGTGAAYIFQRSGSTWSQVGMLTASDKQAGDNFGESVAITDQYAVIGAQKDDDKGTDSGSVYVFQRNGSNWVQMAKLVASNGATSDYFGKSVSISGNNIVVGAYNKRTDTDGGVGAAYWFELVDGTWQEEGFLRPEHPVTGTGYADYTGWSVGVGGDFAIAGSMYDCEGSTCSGAAYIFGVPEPATLLMLGFGALGVLSRRRAVQHPV